MIDKILKALEKRGSELELAADNGTESHERIKYNYKALATYEAINLIYRIIREDGQY